MSDQSLSCSFCEKDLKLGIITFTYSKYLSCFLTLLLPGGLTMVDKIKVNLSYYVYNTLLHDMVQFEAFKPNGDVNRNDFLNCVIYNFYYNKLKKREWLKGLLERDAILTDVSKKSREKMLDSAVRIMDDFYSEDPYRYHQRYFMIYPTKVTSSFFNRLYEDEVKNKVSLSAFIRRLLNEYAYLPQYVRENVIKRKEYIELDEASASGNIVVIHFSGTEKRIAPFKLATNLEETFNYLLGLDLESKELKPISIKLSKIYDVTVSKEKHKFSKEQHAELMGILASGIEFASGDILKVRIRVSKGALRMLKFRYHERPDICHIADDEYEVSCTLSNFIDYFIPFGKEISVLDNDDLKERMFKFYSAAAENYR